MTRLKKSNRLIGLGNTLSYVRYIDDFDAIPLGSQWTDTTTAGFASDKVYIVQTNPRVIERCIIMATREMVVAAAREAVDNFDVLTCAVLPSRRRHLRRR